MHVLEKRGIFGDLIYPINDVFLKVIFLSIEGYNALVLVDHMHIIYKGEFFSKLVSFKHGGILSTSTCWSHAHSIKRWDIW